MPKDLHCPAEITVALFLQNRLEEESNQKFYKVWVLMVIIMTVNQQVGQVKCVLKSLIKPHKNNIQLCYQSFKKNIIWKHVSIESYSLSVIAVFRLRLLYFLFASTASESFLPCSEQQWNCSDCLQPVLLPTGETAADHLVT